MRALFGVVAALTAATLQTAVEAAEYPARPIRMIVPYAPGGASDFFARVLAERFTAAGSQMEQAGTTAQARQVTETAYEGRYYVRAARVAIVGAPARSPS